MARAPILAAGGIVTQRGNTPLIAVVRMRKRNDWVLPKGKLDDGETPRQAAEREVLEETGHQVSVHEFLGTLAYEAGGRAKVVHYWRMEADSEQTHELMNDIKAVAWLPLEEAVARLTRFHEQAFLAQVGPLALEAAAMRAAPRRPPAKRVVAALSRPVAAPAANINSEPKVAEGEVENTAPAPRSAEPDTAMDIADAMDLAEATEVAVAADVAEADAPALAPEPFAREYPVAPRSPDRAKSLLEKAWLWLRGKA
jgi:8-oxo-dGTP diphosphatase